MRTQLRLATLWVTCLSIPFLLIPATSFAQLPYLHSSYNNGYDDGYEDGYDDAMDDCPCPPQKISYTGFYLGAGLGYEGYQINRNPWIGTDYFGSLHTHANGWNGRLYGGYSWLFNNNFYLGAEAYLSGSTASGTDRINTLAQYEGKVSIGTSYGLSLLPGYKLPGGLLTYARVGYVNTDITVRDSITGMSNSTSKWTSGYNLGVGVEFPVTQKLTGRFEYDYMHYDSFTNPGTATGSNNQPRDNMGWVGLNMRF